TDFRLIRALSPRPVRTACLMHSSLITGSIPGMAASTSDTCELGSPPNAVEAPENSFALEVTCAWTSMPITTSQSPVAPLMSFEGLALLVMTTSPQSRGRASDQRPRDLLPLRLERAGCRLPLGLPVPVARIVEIALDAMQIGVHPGGIGAALLHDDAMRLVPVPLGCPPQRAQQRRYRRRAVSHRLLELGKRRHLKPPIKP